MSKNPSRQSPAAPVAPSAAPEVPANPTPAATTVPATRKRGPRTDLDSFMSPEDKKIMAQAKAVQDATRARIANEAATQGATTAKSKVLAFLNDPTTTASEIVAMGNKVEQLHGYRNGTKQRPGAKIGDRRRGSKNPQ